MRDALGSLVEEIAAYEQQDVKVVRIEANKEWVERWASGLFPAAPGENEPDDFITRIKREEYEKAVAARTAKPELEPGDLFSVFGIPGIVREAPGYRFVTAKGGPTS